MNNPPGTAPPAPAANKSNTALIVIAVVASVLVLIVVIVGILAALAISGARKYIARAKQAEARSTVTAIANAASSRFQTDLKLRPSASVSVPTSPAQVRGTKYVSSPADWQLDASRNAGFACLGFSMSTPQYYQYSYEATGIGQPGAHFEVTARGDLNGDGELSVFRIRGEVTSSGISLGTMEVTNPEE